MKAHEDILHSLNMLHKQFNKTLEPSKQLVLDKCQHQDPIAKGMNMEMIGSHEA
jgi:hypothetical protein